MNVSNPKTIEKDKIKVEEFSYDYWSFDTDYEQSEYINIQLNKKLQHILKGKKKQQMTFKEVRRKKKLTNYSGKPRNVQD